MTTVASPFELRPYQLKANSNIAEAFLLKNVWRQLIVCATGGGKTEIFSRTNLEPRIKEWMQRFPETHRVIMVIAHRGELITQAAEKIQRANPDARVEIEKADQHASDDADIVVASVQTLAAAEGRRIGKFDVERIRILVCDEAHHSTSSSYIKVFQYFGFLPPDSYMENEKPHITTQEQALQWQRKRLEAWDRYNPKDRLLLGVTATPKRGDSIGLEAVYQDITFTKHLRDLIREGYLCRPRAIKVDSTTSLDGVSTRAGDFAQNELASAVNKSERNRIAARAYLEHAAGMKAVGFCVDVQHAKDAAEVFNANGIKSAVIDGTMDKAERKKHYDDYAHGDLMALFNCQVLTEGWDEPRAQCAIMLAPTKSGLKYQQCVGRILRLFPGKDDALIIDVVDVTRRHSLVTAADLFGLPIGFDAKGEDLEQLAAKVDELRAENPHLNFDTCKSIEDIELKVETVDLFALEPADIVKEAAKLNWVQSGEDTFHFLYQGQDWNENIELRRDQLGRWDAWLTVGFKNPERLFHGAPDTESALRRAEQWIFSERHEAYQKNKQNSPWRKAAPSVGSINYAKKLGINVDYKKVNAGQLSDLIKHRVAKSHMHERLVRQHRLEAARRAVGA